MSSPVAGVPSETREEAQREPTAKEVEAIMERNPELTLQKAQKEATPTQKVTSPYIRGLLDRNIKVTTSRAVMASSYYTWRSNRSGSHFGVDLKRAEPSI